MINRGTQALLEPALHTSPVLFLLHFIMLKHYQTVDSYAGLIIFAYTFPWAWDLHSAIFTWPVPPCHSRFSSVITLQGSMPGASPLCFYNFHSSHYIILLFPVYVLISPSFNHYSLHVHLEPNVGHIFYSFSYLRI